LHTIEFRRQLASNNGVWNRLELEWPTVRSSGVPRRAYWHVVTPGNIVLTSASSELFGEYTSGWSGLKWGRWPILDQTQLEDWTVASHAAPPPPTTNQYLFSSFGAPVICHASVVRSAWLVALASTACFLLLMLIPYRLGRTFVFWALAIIVLLAIAALRTELAVLLFQGLLGGVAIALLAAILRRLLLGSFIRSQGFSVPTGSTADFESPTQIHPHWESRVDPSATGEQQASVSASGSHA